MKLTQELALKQTQTLKLTPQLQLAVKVLQANQFQLTEMVEQELLENPVLENQETGTVEAPEFEHMSSPDTDQAKLLQYVKDFEKYFQESQDNYVSSYSIDSGSSHEESSFEDYVAGARTLKDVLGEQLYLSVKTELDRKIGEYIIASLDSNGYLRETPRRLAESLQVDEDDVESVLTLMQSFEPAGIGARDLRECLLIQYYQLEMEDSLVRSILENHLEDLANNRMKEIAQQTGATFQEINIAAEKIRSLNPRPASGYLHEVSTAETITPDLFVTIEEDEIVI